MTTTKPATLDEKTRVPMGIVVAGLVGAMPVIGWFTWLAVTIHDIQSTLQDMRFDIADIRDGATSRSSMEAWVREFKALNPELRVPGLAE